MELRKEQRCTIVELGPGVRTRRRFWAMVESEGINVGDVVSAERLDAFQESLPRSLRSSFKHSCSRMIFDEKVEEDGAGGLIIRELD